MTVLDDFSEPEISQENQDHVRIYLLNRLCLHHFSDRLFVTISQKQCFTYLYHTYRIEKRSGLCCCCLVLLVVTLIYNTYH